MFCRLDAFGTAIITTVCILQACQAAADIHGSMHAWVSDGYCSSQRVPLCLGLSVGVMVVMCMLQVHVNVSIPARPSKEETQLVEKLREVQAEQSKRPSFGKWKF